MNNMSKKNDVIKAYRKFKSFVYHDKVNLLLRQQLAEFESSGDVERRLEKLDRKLASYSAQSAYWRALFQQLSCWKFVKETGKDENTSNNSQIGKFISNKHSDSELFVNKESFFIKAPVELHVCCALWAIKVGYRLELKMKNPPYANKIILREDNGSKQPVVGIRFYSPYHVQYQLWRNGAIKSAKRLVEDKKNALIIGLDVMNYYNSIQIDVKELSENALNGNIPADLVPLCNVVTRIHQKYTRDVIRRSDLKRNQQILPIGLMSSGVMANFYLDGLDSKIKNTLRPDYYGRYVDDILLVISCPDNEDFKDVNSVVKEYFVKTKLFLSNDKNGRNGAYYFQDMENIEFQPKKLSIFLLSAGEPTALLDNFIAKIRKNSSEYQLLPDDEVIEKDFNEAAYRFSHEGTGNKLRDIKELSEDKFGISKYLAKKMYLALQSDHKKDKEAVSKLVSFFKGPRAVELSSLWEKVFTFLVINRSHKELLQVIEQICGSVKQLTVGEAEVWREADRQTYREYMFAAISMALSLKPSLLEKSAFASSLKALLSRNQLAECIDEGIKSFRESNLIRHNLVVVPLMNYVVKDGESRYFDLIEQWQYLASPISFEIHPDQFRFSPRFVHFHEVTMFYIASQWSNQSSDGGYFVQTSLEFGNPDDQPQDYLDVAFKLYYKFNYSRNNKEPDTESKKYLSRRDRIYKSTLSDKKNQNFTVKNLYVNSESINRYFKIGIVNIRIPRETLKHRYLRNPKNTPERRKNFNSLLNYAEKEKIQILVLPEISVPVAWFKWLAEHARQRQRCLIFGLEHWIVGNSALNLIVCMMPIEHEGLKSLVISLRLKNHYSPKEKLTLQGYRYMIPTAKPHRYDLINWRGCHFTAFNCYELSDIVHRSFFRSKLDLLTVSEYNKDIEYFSNVIESATRDLHCYSIQVNDASYGDSCVLQPTKAEVRDKIRVKGGENTTVLICNLDLEMLREFQIKEYSGQKELDTFKPTPPDFDRCEVKKRMKE